MSALRTIFSAVAEPMMPDTTMARMRFRTTLDVLLTLGVTALAVGLAVGYQVIGRWARRSGSPD